MSAPAVVRAALQEVGYLEKATNADLDSKTANAGYNNWTKYGAWYGSGLNGYPWCDMFVSWCAAQAGETEAVGKYAYCPSHVSFFQARNRWYPRGTVTPQPGDIIFFQSGGEASHVGIVEYAAGNLVHTVEGNTSSAAGLVPNGGGVFQKSYYLTSACILGYGRPAYGQGEAARTRDADTAGATGREVFPVAKTYQNGSTDETVYADTRLTIPIGSLNPWESCDCLGIVDGRYLVEYRVDGADYHKCGFVAYSGGVTA